MNKYIILYRDSEKSAPVDSWKMTEGKAETEMSFIEDLPSYILNKDDWVVYRVTRGTHKEAYTHDGALDDLIEE